MIPGHERNWQLPRERFFDFLPCADLQRCVYPGPRLNPRYPISLAKLQSHLGGRRAWQTLFLALADLWSNWSSRPARLFVIFKPN